MSTSLFTQIHVALSLAGIAAGFVVLFGMLNGKAMNAWTAIFLVTTVATSVTGFGFPIHEFGPPHIVGVLSLIVLAIAILARYALHLAGAWRKTYVIASLMALYFNVFVGVVQAFQKVPALSSLAPKQTEPPFQVTQLVVLVAFIALTILATKRFRHE